MVTITIEVPDAVKDDAEKQLNLYSANLDDKLLRVIEEYALEYRRNEAKKEIESDIDIRVDISDLILI